MKYLLALPALFCFACLKVALKPAVELPILDQQVKIPMTITPVTEQSSQCAKTSVSKFLQNFIQIYTQSFLEHGNEIEKLQKKFFTKKFYDKVYCVLYPEKMESKKCFWDSDPVLDVQDWDENWNKTLQITQIELTPDQRCKVNLSFHIGSAQHKLTYFLVKDGEDYLIDEVERIL